MNWDKKLEIFASPVTGKALHWSEDGSSLKNDAEEYVKEDTVIRMLDLSNQSYEGAYLNKIIFIPKFEIFPFTLPLWMMSNGYVWEVRKVFKGGDLICELGCASGVNYFGSLYTMAGLDYSFTSLKNISNYTYRIQADAIRLPFQNGSLDGIISSYFWEHILPEDKELMLKEFNRVLKPGGKVVMLYDIETNNHLIELLKKDDLARYEFLFKEGDYHIGYETIEENYSKFEKTNFKVIKHYGMERTCLQSRSVYIKLSEMNTAYGRYAKIMKWVTSNRYMEYLNIFMVRLLDETFGRLWKQSKSRILLSVLEKP
ncbi:MAG: methyltransferase domain-containing protein [Chitinophagaceae bacterium]